MSLDIPDPLLQLEANCGVFAVWLILKQYQSNIDIAELIQLCRHDYNEGTFTIALAVALKKLGFEKKIYLEAKQLQIPIRPALTYEKIQQAYEDGKFVIVFYDTLDGAGNQSLIYSIDEQEISFCDHFEVMSKAVFEQQYQADEICQQAIVVEQPLNFYPI